MRRIRPALHGSVQYDSGMSNPIQRHSGLPSSRGVSHRLRMHMGDKKISRAKLALSCGINRTSLGKKLDDGLDFTIEDVSAICDALDLSVVWLLLGEGDAQSADAAFTGESSKSAGLGIKSPKLYQLSYRGVVRNATGYLARMWCWVSSVASNRRTAETKSDERPKLVLILGTAA